MASEEDMEMVRWEEEGLNHSDSNDGLLDSHSEGPLLSDNPHITSEGKDQVRADSMEHILMCVTYDLCGDQPMTYNTDLQEPDLSTALPPSTKKIKPVRRPGLKLKTPIAYRRDSDINMIPITKDGMAVCEKCGAIGVKHAFYTKERRFCSLSCARGADLLDSNEMDEIDDEEPLENPGDKVATVEEEAETIIPDRPACTPLAVQATQTQTLPLQSSIESSSNNPPTAPEVEESVGLKLPVVPNTYEWTSQLHEPGFIAAPVSCFQHAPMSDCWDNITVGMKVEVENKDTDNFSEIFPDSFWVATVLNIAGYKVLLRYEGFGQDSSKDFWVNLCSEDVHPVGWCATRGKPLIPPKTIQSKYNDWKEFLMKRLTGARTLPSNFHSKVVDSLESRFSVGMRLEVVDKNRISQVRVAQVSKIVGKRLHICYDDAPEEDMGFWCHEDSPLIHPVGWAHQVGHAIVAPAEYHERCAWGEYLEGDATPELFHQLEPPPESAQFKEGMKLEAIDPLNLSAICVATVMKVLRDHYIMIRIDGYEVDASGSDWFCYHSSSPCLFPAGFCELNSIQLTPPKGYGDATSGPFKWLEYVKETKSIAAPVLFFNRDVPNHGFKVGMKAESADLMDPRLICVATVSRVVGRLLKIHFDGWEEEYDQWLDCQSPDIYPVGWCQLVGHKLEGPRQAFLQKKTKKKQPKRRQKRLGNPNFRKRGGGMATRGRGGVYRGGRGRGRGKGRFAPTDNKTEASSSDEARGSSSSQVHQALPHHMPSYPSVDMDDSFDFDFEEEEEEELEMEVASRPSPPTAARPSSPTISAGGNVSTNNYYQQSSKSSGKNVIIPRLVDSNGGTSSSGGGSSSNGHNHELLLGVSPDEWDVSDVTEFLRVNDCASYCDSFSHSQVDGNQLLSLTKDQIIALTGMKVGPSLKIYDLIQQLKARMISAQARIRANLIRVTS